jgi:hypothetical protein
MPITAARPAARLLIAADEYSMEVSFFLTALNYWELGLAVSST